jgi:hypothetical protein
MIKTMKKSINLMTVKEIKEKFTTNQMLDMIVEITKKAEKIKEKVRFANNEFFAEVQADLYNLEISKIRKLESIVY